MPAFAAPPTPWDLQLEKGKRAPTTVTATNRCKATHSFEVSAEASLTWMTFPGARSVEVAPGVAGTVPVLVNASGLDVGEVEGDVTVRCLDCKADLLCAQDVDTFHVRLKVLWPEEELKRLDPNEFVPEKVMLAFDDDARSSPRPPGEYVHATVARSESFTLPSVRRRISLLTLPPGSSVALTILEAQKNPAVRLAQPNFVYELAQVPYNDPYAAEQWGPRHMGIEAAHRTSMGRGVKIAVLDSGVVAAAGNSGPSSPPRYPAALPNVIAVSAIDSNDKLYAKANRGPHVKVVAPGVDVFTTLPDGRYGPSTGTSIDLGPPGKDDLYGWGAVDACRAVARATNRAPSCE